jgi:hypothetical protein
MKKLLFFPVLSLCLGVHAQTSFPYYTGFDDAAQKAGWTEYRLADQGTYRWGYDAFNAYSAPEALSHYYPVGGTQITENWFVSPAFDFSLGGSIDSLRYSFSGFGTPAAGDTVAIYLLEGAQHPDSATAQTLLFDFRDTIYKNDNVWRKLENIPIPTASSNAYIAFKYVTVANWLDVRFDNLALSGNGIGITERPQAANVQLYPNPAQDYIALSGVEAGNLTLLDASGRVLLERWVSEGERIDVSAYSGLLLYRLSDENRGTIASGKLLVGQ